MEVVEGLLLLSWKKTDLPRDSTVMHSVPGRCYVENRWHYHVERALGHPVNRRRGPSPCQPEDGVHHHVRRLLL